MTQSSGVLEERVRAAFRQVFRIDAVPEDASPVTMRDWDSLHHLTLMVELETALGIEITTQEYAEMLSYRAIVETLVEKVRLQN